jgi:hypothetical protein
MKSFFKPIIFALASVVTLASCTDNSGKIPLPYTANATLVELSIRESINTIDELGTLVLVFGVSTCNTCKEFKKKAPSFARSNHYNIYYATTDTIAEEEKEILEVLTTFGGDKTYAYSNIRSVPVAYIFVNKYVVTRIDVDVLPLLGKTVYAKSN